MWKYESMFDCVDRRALCDWVHNRGCKIVSVYLHQLDPGLLNNNAIEHKIMGVQE